METKPANKEITSTNWKAFWQLLKEANPPKWIFILAIFLSLIETGAGLIVPLFTKALVDQLAASALEASLIILLAAAFIIQTVSSGFSFYFMTYIGEAIVASIRKRLWEQVLSLPIPFFDQHQSGETMSRVTQDTNIVKNLITQHLITFLTGLISIIGSIIILLLIDWKMTLIMIISVPISIVIIMPLGQKMYKISKSTQDEMADFSGNLGRVLADIRLVKAYHAENTEKRKGNLGIQHLFQFGLREAKIQAVISPFMTFIMMLVLVILIGYGGVQVASGALSAGSLVAIIIYMFQIVVPFTQMASFFTAFQKAVGATERIQEILGIEKETSLQTRAVENSAMDLTFHNLSFAYKENPIIKNMNLTVPSGKTTAFVGPSGSGKTTLFALLERFYKPESGEILLGETNITAFNLYSWRSQIGYVSQESPLMSGTIRENICYGIEHQVSDKEIQQAAELANAAEFIERLPKGFETEVGERGMKLSGGQRQRIAIARALIRNPKILLLDEATSNLDSASEHLVQQALQQLMAGRTTLVIAHRLSTIVEADQIAVIEDGRITGTGSHHELLESHELYRKLAEQQLGEQVMH
ncbi:ABC transporter ATP-binding protein [Cytobacillus solani]|uniref:Multidrug ABC transporter permease n=1 Tax=Cytobacillus solani TaxID=1637975 RepID=A0A0Q3QU09_9BACI|nr:ABC transporter ATP-binding protein [Cytobacillus solani]KOP71732.1 multidrug ABC transporter permease [Bacillus sp. FJAT-21945]KQL21593.1 multidrug ABC transporter permease [Cytobacillus solani]USK54903.1 ABC transporter ATP-binding protein/permease [Cytobacillus solani]